MIYGIFLFNYKKNNEKGKALTEKHIIVLMFSVTFFSVFMGILIERYVILGSDAIMEFAFNFKTLTKNYYEDVDEEKLLQDAFDTILEQIDDPYTTKISDEFFEILSNKQPDLGVEVFIDENNSYFISKVTEGSDASKNGIEKGHKILKVNGKECSGVDFEEFNNIINEIYEYSNKIVFTVEDKSGIQDIIVNIENLEYDNITTNIYNSNDKKIGYINMESFSKDCYKDFKQELENLEGQNINSLIIDLRENTGGYTNQLEKILSLFLDNSHVIYKEQTKNNMKEVYSKGTVTKTYPIVILANETTASCSEVMIAALMEEYGATIIGTTTFGKGISQTVQMTQNYSYKYTFSKWFTPKGDWIHDKGIEPTIKVEAGKLEDGTDIQLKTAIDYIGNL